MIAHPLQYSRDTRIIPVLTPHRSIAPFCRQNDPFRSETKPTPIDGKRHPETLRGIFEDRVCCQTAPAIPTGIHSIRFPDKRVRQRSDVAVHPVLSASVLRILKKWQNQPIGGSLLSDEQNGADDPPVVLLQLDRIIGKGDLHDPFISSCRPCKTAQF